jgi:hypothetical protein
MKIAARLKRLAQTRSTDGCGPNCPPHAVVLYRQDGFDGEPTLDEGQRPPAPCPRCGRPALVQEMVLIYDPDFFHNEERLRNLTTQQTGTAAPAER